MSDIGLFSFKTVLNSQFESSMDFSFFEDNHFFLQTCTLPSLSKYASWYVPNLTTVAYCQSYEN